MNPPIAPPATRTPTPVAPESFQRKLEPRRARQRSAHGAREREVYPEHGVGWDGDLARCTHTQAVRAMNRKIIITTNLVAIVFSMTSVLAYTWFSSFAGGLYVQIPTTLLTASLLIALFFEKTRQGFALDNIQRVSLWLSIPVALVVVALSNLYLERLVSIAPTWLALNIGFLFMVGPPAYIYWQIARKRQFLVMAAALNIGIAWLWLVLEVLKAGAGVEFVLGPLAIAMYAGVPWILALRLSLECAKRTQHCRHLGPLMESLTMFLVAVPLVTLAILSVMAVTDGQHWMALAGIVVSFLFSSAVATPFRKFLRALGRLDEQQRGMTRP